MSRVLPRSQFVGPFAAFPQLTLRLADRVQHGLANPVSLQLSVTNPNHRVYKD